MNIAIPLLIFLTSNSSVSVADNACLDFTVGECHISSDLIIWQHDKMNPSQCQLACSRLFSCLLFRHDGTTCFFLNQDYRQTCDTTGAPAEASVEECEDVILNTCSGFLEEDCTYTGEDLGLDPPDGEIPNALECQQYCQDFDFLGCKYWVFNHQQQSCQLKSSGDRDCSGISGPKEPSIEECMVFTSTTKTTTSTTTLTTTTTAPPPTTTTATTSTTTTATTTKTTTSTTTLTTTTTAPPPTTTATTSTTTTTTTTATTTKTTTSTTTLTTTTTAPPPPPPTTATATTSTTTTATTTKTSTSTTTLTTTTTTAPPPPTTTAKKCPQKYFRAVSSFDICKGSNKTCGGSVITWEFRDDGKEVYENVNGRSGIALGDEIVHNVDFNGTFVVNTGDDDFVGFVFGFQDEKNFFVVHSPRVNVSNGFYQVGWRLTKVASSTGTVDGTMQGAILTPTSVEGQTEILWVDDQLRGWTRGISYRWRLQYRSTSEHLRFWLYEDEQELLDTGLLSGIGNCSGSCAGKLGVFSHSQPGVTWNNMVYRCPY